MRFYCLPTRSASDHAIGNSLHEDAIAALLLVWIELLRAITCASISHYFRMLHLFTHVRHSHVGDYSLSESDISIKTYMGAVSRTKVSWYAIDKSLSLNNRYSLIPKSIQSCYAAIQLPFKILFSKHEWLAAQNLRCIQHESRLPGVCFSARAGFANIVLCSASPCYHIYLKCPFLSSATR